MAYEPSGIEPKWQKYWAENKSFQTKGLSDKPKYYVLDMFPYPSGAGLHVGHVEGYTATDIMARYHRMTGHEVLHPMGWDAFGLPAEQHAIETGVHPMNSTQDNVGNFRKQCDTLGLSYDWAREIDTSKPDYYKWTQWLFLRMLEHDLAYRTEALVNWCPALGTVLANDEVIDGRSERGGHEVIRKPLTQWMLRITAYADRLLKDLDKVDYPESILAMQRDRIGRSEGADLTFSLVDHDSALEVFTTRPDTLFGATFCVLAPEHPLVDKITKPEHKAAVDEYVRVAATRSDLDRSGRDAGKTGVFTGAYAVNPITKAELPVWVADYVLMTYGTGAIMCVPGHDQRDWDFAKRFDLPIVEVIAGGDVTKSAYESDGILVNSDFLNGLKTKAAIARALDWLEEKGIGQRKVRYKMRDWIFARQRYWGEPVPVVHGTDGKIHPLPENELPLLLPMLENFTPSGGDEVPLGRLPEWVATTVPGTDQPARRETHTMPTLAGSAWYFFRFIDPLNAAMFCDPELARRWMPVDLYIGGAEHAVGHLLYSRFFTKFLFDIGKSPVDEPYRKLVNPGMILGNDRRKMSKRYGNVVNPTDVVNEHGADAVRLYEMFLGPLELNKPWDPSGIVGVRRFLDRVWRLFFDDDDKLRTSIVEAEPDTTALQVLHQTIDKVRTEVEALRFNTAIAQLMTFVNEVNKMDVRPRAIVEPFVLLLTPFAPHIAEEIWERLGHPPSLVHHPLPEVDSKYLVVETVEVPVQVNGKVLARLHVSRT
ncbi:MAG: leucine--tRNA ligase, partial [Myxococcota bacterium]